jgi:hypothetical protein
MSRWDGSKHVWSIGASMLPRQWAWPGQAFRLLLMGHEAFWLGVGRHGACSRGPWGKPPSKRVNICFLHENLYDFWRPVVQNCLFNYTQIPSFCDIPPLGEGKIGGSFLDNSIVAQIQALQCSDYNNIILRGLLNKLLVST